MVIDNDTRKKLLRLLYSMRTRCDGDMNYITRGIFVCSEWEDNPDNFVKWALDNGYAAGLSIHRIDRDLWYGPTNCVFMTKSGHARLHHASGHTDRPKLTWSKYKGNYGRV